MIPGEKLILHGRRSISASCKALELECRDEDFREKKSVWFFRTLKNLGEGNTNGIMVWAWMLWSPYALVTGTELWFGHGCSGHRMLLEHAYLAAFAGGGAKVLENRRPNMCVDQLPDGIMGMCPATPGTWRTRGQTPSILQNNL